MKRVMSKEFFYQIEKNEFELLFVIRLSLIFRNFIGKRESDNHWELKFTQVWQDKWEAREENKISLTGAGSRDALEVGYEETFVERVLIAYPIHNHLCFVTSDHRLLNIQADFKSCFSEKDLSGTTYLLLVWSLKSKKLKRRQ